MLISISNNRWRLLMISEEKIREFKKLRQSGEIYNCSDEDFIEYQHHLVQKIYEYNHTPETDLGLKKREQILKETVGIYGENLTITPPVDANCGLDSVSFGKNVYVNYNCSFVDDGNISFGDYSMIGPNVTFATAAHPISPKLRQNQLQYNKSINIGKNVWIGAGAIILPGVTIGDNSIIGAGSIVNKDVQSNIIVAGNPAKKIRSITEKDDQIYDHDKIISQDIREKYL